MPAISTAAASPSANDPVISLRGVSTRFGETLVHRDIDLDVEAGQILGLVGGSGSGKTTLLREIVGLLVPSSGSVRLFGHSVFDADPLVRRNVRRRFGMLFQQGALFSALSVYDNIAFPLRELRALDEAMIRELVYLKLAMVELEPRHAQLMPSELSGGMVKRVALARALSLEPELLVLDEPTAGLDPDLADNFVKLIRMLQKELGFTVVMVTHDLDTLAGLATHVAVLADQRIIACGTPAAVLAVDHPFIHRFFSSEHAALLMQKEVGLIMENRSHALLAGLFALLLGLSSVAALWWFGGKQEVTNEYLVVTTKTISGLSQQAQVRYRGVRVGKVESIELDPADVSNTLIRISVRKDIPITRGTTAKLGFQGVTGIAFVLLEDSGKDAALLVASAGELAKIPMQESLFQELSSVAGETLRNARDLLASANQTLSPENRQRIEKTLANLEATTGNAREATASLRQVLTPENIRLLNSTLTRAEQTAGQAGPFFAEARGLVARLNAVSEKLDVTLGDPLSSGALVPRLADLSADLSSSSHQLNRVLQMLEDSPQSLIFGRHKASPGPGESGFIAPETSRGQP